MHSERIPHCLRGVSERIRCILPYIRRFPAACCGELQLFGNEYAEYCKKVKRIIPNFNNYWSKNKFEIYPKVFFRSMVHASFFMWLFILLEFLEYFKENTKLIPTLFYLPF